MPEVVEADIIFHEKVYDNIKYYHYCILVKWADYFVTLIFRRYNDFVELQSKLEATFVTKKNGRADAEYIEQLSLPGKTYGINARNHQVAHERVPLLEKYLKTLIRLPSHISKDSAVLKFFTSNENDLYYLHERKVSVALPTNSASISSPLALPQYVVTRSHEKASKNEVSARVGETVGVAKKTSTGWWLIHHNFEFGWFPSSHLQPLASDGSNAMEEHDALEEELQRIGDIRDSLWFAIKDYRDKSEERPSSGPGEMLLTRGCLVCVREVHAAGWWKVATSLRSYLQTATTQPVPSTFLRPLRSDFKSLLFVGDLDLLHASGM